MLKPPIFVLFALIFSFYPALRVGAENRDADIVYKVTINEPAKGEINVRAVFNKITGPELVISELELSKYLNLTGLKAKNGQGLPLAIRFPPEGMPKLEKKKYAVRTGGAKTVTIEYAVRPGTVGRHGHIGWLDGRFGLTAGKNLFLFPLNKSGLNKITPPLLTSAAVTLARSGGVTVEFKLPRGWEAVSAWGKDGGVFTLKPDYYGHRFNMTDILGEAVIGFGNFRVCERDMNGFNARIYTFSGWTEERSGAVCEEAFKLIKYQLDLFGFNGRWDYTVIFVPDADDKERRIFGGCWSSGVGYEMAEPATRRWELFSHRVHHMFNKYPPFSMRMAGKSNGWFVEATPSYYEIKALASMGEYKLEDRIFSLKKKYDRERPKYDAPLSRDYTESHEVVEYLHYKKAPLVAYLMDKKIKKDTNGKKNLDQFLKYLYSRYGMNRGAADPKEELERFTGSDFKGFFAKYVDSTGRIELDLRKYINALAIFILLAVVIYEAKAKFKSKR